MIKIKTFGVIFASIILISCWGFIIPAEDETEYNISFSVFPDAGTTGTEFTITIDTLYVNTTNAIHVKNDPISQFYGYKFRWDLDGDGTFDTNWNDSFIFHKAFNTTGRIPIIAEIKTPEKEIIKDTCTILVQPIIKLIENTSDFDISSVDWALEGSNLLAFENLSDNIRDNQICEQAIWIMDYPAGGARQVSQNCATFPEWSHDGEHVLFRREQEFWIANIEQDTEQFLFKQSGVIQFIPSWSYNNRKLVFTMQSSIGIYLISTGKTSTIPTDITYSLASWAPDDQTIAALARNNEQSAIDLIDIEEGKISDSFVLGFNYLGGKIDWSPDGKWLSIGFANNNNTIYLLDLETHKFKHININNFEKAWYATWSPDGKMIAFVGSAPNEKATIWAVEVPDNF